MPDTSIKIKENDYQFLKQEKSLTNIPIKHLITKLIAIYKKWSKKNAQ